MRVLLIILLSFVVLSCKDDETVVEQPYVIPEADVVLFDKFARMGAEAEKIWPGYDYYRTIPIYFLLSNDSETEYRGYLINPPSTLPEGSEKLNDEQSQGLNIYRNDKHTASAKFTLGPLGVFNPNAFKIDGTVYYLVKDVKTPNALLPFYQDFQDVNDNWLSIVSIHEMFHTWQFAKWKFPPGTKQDFPNYPITKEVATVHFALFDLMKSLSDAQTSEGRKAQLSKFVALLEELFIVDPTPEKLLKQSVPLELFLEGTARYMEHYSALTTIYPTIDDDLTHGWAAHLPVMSTNLTRHFLSKRVWYHVGSGALFLLNKEGINVTAANEAGETAYSLAKNHVALTEEQRAAIIAELRASPKWDEYEEMASKLAVE